MILIADSGSTKTDWTLINFPHPGQSDIVATFHTQGINPVHQEPDVIRHILGHELMSQLSTFPRGALINSRVLETPLLSQLSVFFYGSGCTPVHAPRMKQMLSEVFTPQQIEVHSDLTAAARALCGRQPGVACILGTGSNSCLYDGTDIVANTPALGYILGDEGSGSVLGRKFLNALYKGRLPEQLKMAFEQETKLTQASVIQHVYREPLANRFLASLSLFISNHLDEPLLRTLVIENFREFLQNNVAPYRKHSEYHADSLPVSFVGSVAQYYENELREAAGLEGFTVGVVMKSPMEGLVRYHSEQA